MKKDTSIKAYTIASLIFDLLLIAWLVLLSFLESQSFTEGLLFVSLPIITISLGWVIRLNLFKKKRFNEITMAMSYAPMFIALFICALLVFGIDAFDWVLVIVSITTGAAVAVGYLIADFCDFDDTRYYLPPL